MHSYLRAIGFSNIKTRADFDSVIGMVMDQPTAKYTINKEEKIILTEISKDFGERMGITLRGEYDEKGFFHLEHYFPHFRGQSISLKEDTVFNKRVDNEAYTGMCDDIRLGVSLIFYLQNVIDYLKSIKQPNGQILLAPVSLSGLSTSGKVILGLDQTERESHNKSSEAIKRNKLITDARNGDQEAIDSLTIDDIDLYATVSRRARYEDVYTIVDSSFIPYGSESDNYSIVGTILDVNLVVNQLTNEHIYDLLISCNELNFNVCINQIDLLGEPLVGRRFKGNLWLQGYINFLE